MSSTETVLWKGTSSQVKNFWWYASCLLIIPIPWAVWNMIKVRCRVFTLTSERLLIDEGVFSKTQDTLELYRVRDLQVKQPFWQRLFGLEDIHLIATDMTTESVMLDYIPTSLNLRINSAPKWRNAVARKACAKSASTSSTAPATQCRSGKRPVSGFFPPRPHDNLLDAKSRCACVAAYAAAPRER